MLFKCYLKYVGILKLLLECENKYAAFVKGQWNYKLPGLEYK